ncbi:MAG: HEPN domain-containing protein [Candidatus Gastranaerophilales bacterium]|nr:HEPN domain-containing protein [Candidatus Gastranaerophilales bacterium]
MKKEQKQLLNKALNSLNAAEVLYEDEYYEFCVSRTYYTMFYIAQAFLLELDLSFSKHSAVISSFGKEFVSTNKIDNRFHRYLIDAQNIRNIGDYDTVVEVSGKEAKTEICRAKEFLNLAKEKLA